MTKIANVKFSIVTSLDFQFSLKFGSRICAQIQSNISGDFGVLLCTLINSLISYL